MDTEGRVSPNTGGSGPRKPTLAPLNMDIVGTKGEEPDELTKELLAAQDSESCHEYLGSPRTVIMGSRFQNNDFGKDAGAQEQS